VTSFRVSAIAEEDCGGKEIFSCRVVSLSQRRAVFEHPFFSYVPFRYMTGKQANFTAEIEVQEQGKS
jgi:hypothetical protein